MYNENTTTIQEMKPKKNVAVMILDWLVISLTALLMISIFLYARYWYLCTVSLVGCIFIIFSFSKQFCFAKYKKLFLVFLAFCVGNFMKDLAFYVLPKWTTVISYSAFVFFAIYLILLVDKEKHQKPLLKMGKVDKRYLLICMLSVLLFIFTLIISKDFLNVLSSINIVLIILYGIIFALTNSFFEEGIFRGFLQNVFSFYTKSDKAGLIYQAIIFAFFHFSKGAIPSGWAGVFLTFIFGLFVGYSVLKTKGILFAWVIHFIADLGVVCIYCLNTYSK